MSNEIEIPVGGVIKVYGLEMVCVEDESKKYGSASSCIGCPLQGSVPCNHINCGWTRTDGKSVHFEYYHGVDK